MPASHRRWIVVKAILVTAAVNAVLNAAIASSSVSGQDGVPVWGVPLGDPSVFGNAIGTLFLLPLITCLLVTTAIRRDVRIGSLEPLGRLRSVHRWLAALPPARLRRGIALGALAVAALAPLLALALAVAGPTELTSEQFVVWQTAFAVALGALVTPAIALYAMADPSE